MAGYPLGSPELRQHVHNMVERALKPVHQGILRATGFVVPDRIAHLETDETWRRWGML